MWKITFVLFTVLFLQMGFTEKEQKSEIRKFTKEWETHKAMYNLIFKEKEDSKRYKIFVDNYNFVERVNKMDLRFQCGMNQFSHMTHQEYILLVESCFKGLKNKKIPQNYSYLPDDSLEVDWRDKHVVSPVKNQGSCGSCWAFSATGNLESQYMLKTGKKVSLSEQDLVDCSGAYGNQGCNGGFMDYAFSYVKAYGIDSEGDYPYTAKDGKCIHKNETSMLKVSEFVDIPTGNEEALTSVVIKYGPVSVAFDASEREFQFYKSGVYESTKCSSTKVNHGLLVVGIGSTSSPHYIVKNSWGKSWGDNGYFLSARNKGNMCGIATYASYSKIQVD